MNQFSENDLHVSDLCPCPDFENNLDTHFRVVQGEGRREILGEGFAIPGQPAADRTCQVTMAVQIACHDRRHKSVRVGVI